MRVLWPHTGSLPESDPNLIYLYSEYKKPEPGVNCAGINLNRFSYYYNTITDSIDKYSTLIHSNGVDPKDLDFYSGVVDIDIIEFIDTYMERGRIKKSSKTGIAMSGYDFNHLLELRKTILRNRNLNDIMDGY